jgi:hypothetical protein
VVKEVKLHAFQTSEIGEGEYSAAYSSHITPVYTGCEAERTSCRRHKFL